MKTTYGQTYRQNTDKVQIAYRAKYGKHEDKIRTRYRQNTDNVHTKYGHTMDTCGQHMDIIHRKYR